MSGEAETLLQQALNLPPDERYQFARRLLDSLDGDDLLPDDPAFHEELNRRLESIANGTAEYVDGEEVFRAISERLRKRRGQ